MCIIGQDSLPFDNDDLARRLLSRQVTYWLIVQIILLFGCFVRKSTIHIRTPGISSLLSKFVNVSGRTVESMVLGAHKTKFPVSPLSLCEVLLTAELLRIYCQLCTEIV